MHSKATTQTARHLTPWLLAFVAISALLLPAAIHADNKIMGEIEFIGKSKVEKTSGVWVDGQYVGYLKELKGAKKVMLLPGEHVISVRQDGYQDFTRKIVVQPGVKETIAVAMLKAPTGPMPTVTAEIKISVNPSRAAVFLDGQFIGHVGEFQGAGRGLLVAPGDHKIKIALPGYKTFESDIEACEVIATGEPWDEFVLVLEDTMRQIAGDSGVEDMGARPVGHDVDEEASVL